MWSDSRENWGEDLRSAPFSSLARRRTQEQGLSSAALSLRSLRRSLSTNLHHPGKNLTLADKAKRTGLPLLRQLSSVQSPNKK